MTLLRRHRKSIELHPRLDGLENGLRAEGFIRLALDATLPPPESSSRRLMATLIITEKTSQAKDLLAALGSRYGRILPAEGHLLRLATR